MQEITRKVLEEKCKKMSLPGTEEYRNEDIPFYKYTTNIVTGENFRELYIVDMTDETIAKLVQDKMSEEDRSFLNYCFEDMFFSDDSNMKWERYLIFMTDEGLKYYDPNIESDFHFIRKRFVRESDLIALLQRQETLSYKDMSKPFSFDGDKYDLTALNGEYNLSHFNLLYGINGSGKTVMLNEISNQFGIPTLNTGVDDFFLYGTDYAKSVLLQADYEKLIATYKRLWNYSLKRPIDFQKLSEFSTAEIKLLMYAAKLSDLEQSDSSIVLLDDLGAGYDAKRTLNTIEYLSDLSLSGKTVVCTTVNQNVQKLVLRKTYNPNMIDLNRF